MSFISTLIHYCMLRPCIFLYGINKEEYLKAYTRLIQYNDSLFIGTSFMPKRNFWWNL